MSTSRKPGKITNYNFPKRGRARLQCTNIVEGHSKAVLALHATDDYLFTASKDRTVVVWDLRGMRESQVFGNFPNSVVAVKYDPQNNLLFSVSSCYIKVWDIRSSKAIRTLNSQGNSTSWSSQSTNFESTNLTINAIALSENSLYTAVCDRVRVWDLRKFSVVGKLLGGHQAAIMCLAVSPTDTGEDVVVTGSKDHYIKIFNVGAEPGLVVTPATLEPPHYDGIQCLALRGETLFSGSRDYVIKKWNLDSHELVTSVNAAHRDWVTDLCFAPSSSVLVSGSRDGNIKLWSVDSCANLAEIKAHDSPINALTSNASHIFSASNDGKCMMWKMSPERAV
uniref:Uncharacterized protein n=1 Tax=Lygus hesperus TaxID=30085 RepID=A0A0K8T836_LYGHE